MEPRFGEILGHPFPDEERSTSRVVTVDGESAFKSPTSKSMGIKSNCGNTHRKPSRCCAVSPQRSRAGRVRKPAATTMSTEARRCPDLHQDSRSAHTDRRPPRIHRRCSVYGTRSSSTRGARQTDSAAAAVQAKGSSGECYSRFRLLWFLPVVTADADTTALGLVSRVGGASPLMREPPLPRG